MHFVYDGINSKNMGIINAILEPGLMEEPFLPSATLHETHTRHNNTPYFNKIKREPLVFNLVCAFEEGLSENKIRQVRRWLAKGSYKELYFCNEPNKRYFAMYEESSLSHTGLDGYFEITFRTNSPYASSELIETEDHTIHNNSDIPIYPEMLLKKQGDGNVTITNSITGQNITYPNLRNNEVIYIDNDREITTSNIRDDYTHHSFLYFIRGENTIVVDGDCQLKFRYREKYLPHGGPIIEEEDEGL